MSNRVLFLDYTNGIGLGGGQRSLQLLLEELDPARFEPVLVCPPDEQLLDIIPAHVRVHSLALPSGFRTLSRRTAGWQSALQSLPALGQSIAQLRQILRQEKPALLHANNMKMHLLASAASAGLGIPRLWHVRDILPANSLTTLLKQAAGRASARVLAVSRAVARQLPASAPVQVLYNAVRLPNPAHIPEWRAAYRLRHGIPSEACVIGYAGRLDSGKGLDSLLDAFTQVHPRSPQTQLLIAGDGPERARLESTVYQRQLHGSVHFAGFESDLNSLYSALDLVVIPSIEPDSFPRGVIEAMAHSLPVIGADSGGISEAIEHVTTGFVLAPGDTASLARIMDALSTNATLRKQQGRAGRQRAERFFSAEAQARGISAIYQELIPAA